MTHLFNNSQQESQTRTSDCDSLVQRVVAGVTDAHFSFDAEAWNDALFGRALATEHLTAVATVVLSKQEHNTHAYMIEVHAKKRGCHMHDNSNLR